MIAQKQYDITAVKEFERQHTNIVSTRKRSVILEKILECPNCTSIFRTWYQSTVTRVTCPKCWAEIPVEDPQTNRF